MMLLLPHNGPIVLTGMDFGAKGKKQEPNPASPVHLPSSRYQSH